MVLSRFLWLTPFITFIIGYLCMDVISGTATLRAPSLVGSSLEKAAVILSQKKLNLRIIGHKDEPDLPEGTIISQIPGPASAMKEQQTMCLLISRKPAPQQVPNFSKKTPLEAATLAEGLGLHARIVPLPTENLGKYCYAQYPANDMPIIDHDIIVYAMQDPKPVIMPQLKGQPLEEVLSFLQLHGCSAEILHAPHMIPGHQCSTCVIKDQRPLAGSLVTFTEHKPITIQLQVACPSL